MKELTLSTKGLVEGAIVFLPLPELPSPHSSYALSTLLYTRDPLSSVSLLSISISSLFARLRR